MHNLAVLRAKRRDLITLAVYLEVHDGLLLLKRLEGVLPMEAARQLLNWLLALLLRHRRLREYDNVF